MNDNESLRDSKDAWQAVAKKLGESLDKLQRENVGLQAELAEARSASGNNRKSQRKETQMDIEENTIVYNGDGRDGEDEPALTPVMIYSLGFDPEELLTVYAGLRTYLKALAGRENEDLEQIHRTTKLLMALRSRAVRASKEIASAAIGIDSRSDSTP